MSDDIGLVRKQGAGTAVDVADQVFIVRMWFESSGARPGAWRGSITHVASRSRWYFAELRELSDFIRLRLDFANADVSATAGL